MKYRPEIDGIRALAVVPVILFHAGFEFFSGGFVGVDVFFVISGYLITTVIMNELASGSFTLLQFYERRARRILPALFFVLILCLPFAWMWLNPKDLASFGRSLVAVPAFVSNFSFWLESGYFDQAAELKPLLHTWSLSVEEQYYILFPLAMILLWPRGLRWITAILSGVFLISLGIAQWGAVNEPNAAFFLLPTRAWELLIGVFVAFYLRNNQIEGQKYLPEVASVLGMALVVYSIVAFDETTPFPGVYALVPTIGTALLILYTSPQTLMFRILSARSLVGVGLISYSAYLWHQPILAFARHRSLGELSDGILLALIALSLVMAAFSWRWVEKPFRDKQKITARAVWSLSLFLSLSFILVGLLLVSNNGFSSRFNTDLSTVKIVTQQHCHNSPKTRDLNLIKQNTFCKLGDQAQTPNTFLLGDSHAGAIADELGEQFANIDEAVYAFSGGFCAPASGFSLQKYGADCTEEMALVLDFVINNSKIQNVIIYAQWSNFTTGKRGKWQPQVACLNKQCADAPSGNRQLFATALADTLSELIDANKRVILIKSTPEFKHHVIENIYKKELSGNKSMFNVTDKRAYLARNALMESIYPSLTGVELVDPFPLFCEADLCQPIQDGVPLFHDTNHLTNFGADRLAQQIIERYTGEEIDRRSKTLN